MTDDIEHSGKLGMKWGVRTRIYTKNKLGDPYTDRQKKKMTKSAIKIYTNAKKTHDLHAEISKKEDVKINKQMHKMITKSEIKQQKGDKKGFEKYQSLAWKQMANHYRQETVTKTQQVMSKTYSQKIKDIESGRKKAGKDFVTNFEMSTNGPLNLLIGNVRTVRTVTES